MKTKLALATALLPSLALAQNSPSLEELAEIVAAQQEQIAAMQSAQSSSPVHIGGYGELHLNIVKDDDNEVDFHRFVLFVGHDFSTRLRFRSEIELEHSLAGDGAPGEVELEQAYIEYDLKPASTVRAGLMLLPIGILNETHEPTTFYGVERNRVENQIIPTTWWEAGVAFSQTLADSGLSYDLMLHSGLAADLGKSSPIRSGRQKVAEALANDPAATARVRYNGIPGLSLAASLQYQSDLSQQPDDGVDDAWLYSVHGILERGAFSVRGLYAGWTINGVAADAQNNDRIFGWYLEPSMKISDSWGVFTRYSSLEKTRGAEESNWVGGLNFWPHQQVVVKADYTRRKNPDDSTVDTVGFGLGYYF